MSPESERKGYRPVKSFPWGGGGGGGGGVSWGECLCSGAEGSLYRKVGAPVIRTERIFRRGGRPLFKRERTC